MSSFTLENKKTDRGAPETVSVMTVLACAWPALLLATVCLLPFLNKAYVNDDTWFLTMAKQIVKHPMHPMDFQVCWNFSNIPVRPGNALLGEEAQGYALVPTVLGGAHEWMAHLTQLPFVWIAVLAMTSLVFRFGWNRAHAITGTLLLVAVTPFLPMASTAMPDILATALALVAIERLAAWKSEHKARQAVAAAIAMGLAPYTRPHLVLLFPLAAFFLLDSIHFNEIVAQIRRKFWLWTPVLAGAAFLLAIIAATRGHSAADSPATVFTGTQFIQTNLRSYLLYFVFPLPLAACWFANRLKVGRWPIVSITTALALAVLFWHHRHRLVSSFDIIGFVVLVDLSFDALRKRDHTDVFLLLWVLIPLPVVYYIQLPIKYLLPCLPAVIFLCFRLMEGFSFRLTRAAAIALIIASTGYSLLILHSDAEYADFGREAMFRLIQPRVAAGERVWFGDEYSSYWYAPLAGAKLTFPGGPQPKPGDLLVVGRIENEDKLLALFPHRTLAGEVSHKYRFGRTMGEGIGFYSNMAGYWLWGLGHGESDRYELWRIDQDPITSRNANVVTSPKATTTTLRQNDLY
ncbi:MAG TPA: hypothetical protein VFA99_17035 [Acidobacteriaceae bacterium]|nr:hypothetical protein [Acidobacteriaceae bacterium]